jgi:uncharacterized protein (TIGR02147 family)
MINVFDYSDFRKYLADYYEDKKKGNPRYSYQVIANKAGIKNKGFIYNIIRGKKALLKSNISRISHALGHTRYEAEYFAALIAFGQAKDIVGRSYLFEKMNTMKNPGKAKSVAQVLRKDQYEFYSNWYHVMVRLIIGMYEFKGDFKWLSKMIDPPITVPQARHSVQLLEKLGLIGKSIDGVYRISDLNITTGKDVTSIAFQNFHMACNALAKRAFAHFPLDARNMTGLSLGVSEDGYKRICEEIQNFQTKIIEITNADLKADRSYQLNFHFFPTSKSSPERKRK